MVRGILIVILWSLISFVYNRVTVRLDVVSYSLLFQVFFVNDTATTEIYTLSLHDALPI